MAQNIGKRIVCAAIKNKYGSIICGPRHFDIVMHNAIYSHVHQTSWATAEQGFIDQKGTFLTREEAFQVAKEAGQIIRNVGGNESGDLYSENLY